MHPAVHGHSVTRVAGLRLYGCDKDSCTALAQVTLLQSGQTILTSFTDNLQNRALETFRKTGVDVRLGVRVTEVTANKVYAPPLQNSSHGLDLSF